MSKKDSESTRTLTTPEFGQYYREKMEKAKAEAFTPDAKIEDGGKTVDVHRGAGPEGTEQILNYANTHFIPMLKEEWKNGLNIFDIGAYFDEGDIRYIAVHFRADELWDAVDKLGSVGFHLDSEQRIRPHSSPVWQDGNTVFVQMAGRSEGFEHDNIVLVVFQIFADESAAFSACANRTSSDRFPPFSP